MQLYHSRNEKIVEKKIFRYDINIKFLNMFSEIIIHVKKHPLCTLILELV